MRANTAGKSLCRVRPQADSYRRKRCAPSRPIARCRSAQCTGTCWCREAQGRARAALRANAAGKSLCRVRPQADSYSATRRAPSRPIARRVRAQARSYSESLNQVVRLPPLRGQAVHNRVSAASLICINRRRFGRVRGWIRSASGVRESVWIFRPLKPDAGPPDFEARGWPSPGNIRRCDPVPAG